MNYFAHGRAFVDDPHFLAGTAVPDWLNVVARKVKVRSKHARAFVEDPDSRVAALARGIEQHHFDDRWFHATDAFAELSWHFTVLIRDHLAADDGLRPSFLGHILVELLLDACLIAQCPDELEAYYRAMAVVDHLWLEAGVARMATGHPKSLGHFIPLFIRERFLWDYLDDGKLCYRLNQVMRRVGLAGLPDTFAKLLPEMRCQVARRSQELLTSTDAGLASIPFHPRPQP
ncbi:MAG TPA: hypothetical protein VG125_24485 [Pirellulales bacterium]|jgi:hypothetical protein|nr:hypothetical protein [Pirellulales bacterium]